MLYIEDVARIVLELEHGYTAGHVGRCSVEIKARYLHSALDQRPLIGRILAEVHWWLTGDDVEHGKLRELGWTTGGVEICADFVGLPWYRHDAGNITMTRSTMKKGDIGKLNHRTWGKDPYFAETVMLGTRASSWSLCLYNKSEQIEEVKGGDSSTYHAIWDAHGLPVEQRDDVSRAELRGCGRGLVMVDEVTGEVVDLRDPMTAADPAVLATVWATMTRKRIRLIMPGRTRRKRCPTDPRWEHVRRAVDAEARPLVQMREAQSNAHEAALRRAERGAMRELQRCAALHGAAIRSPAGYGAMAERIAEAAEAEVLVDLGDYAERYRGLRMAFMGDEIRAAQQQFVGLTLPGIDLAVLPARPPANEWWSDTA